VPCARVNNYAEVLEDPHIRGRDVIANVEHPKAGKLRVLRNPVRFDKDGPVEMRPAPLLGQHTAALLQGLGYTPETIASLEAAGAVQTTRSAG
jgi:crotonobetainyl-CoA:carnitine CoA-transferase CaiB-like acyl-CoA transferase